LRARIVKGQLAILETLDEQIRVMEDKISTIAVDDPQVKLLLTRARDSVDTPKSFQFQSY